MSKKLSIKKCNPGKSPHPMRGMRGIQPLTSCPARVKTREEYNSPFVEGGALMDLSFTQRGWGDLEPLNAICGLERMGY